MARYIFFFAFSLAFFFQLVVWNLPDMLDIEMWANQAKYVETGDDRQFNAVAAYGHPGGPIILGTIYLHGLFGFSYEYSLIVFSSFFSGLIIASIATLCFLLRPKTLWWLVVFASLSIHRMFMTSTPTSAIASILVALLCVLTLYIYERKDSIRWPWILSWALVSGALVATRADIGVITSVAFFILLLQSVGIRKALCAGIGAFGSFALLNPFMWFMPIQHIQDLVSKGVRHYIGFEPTHLSLVTLLDISSLLLVAILLFIGIYFLKEKATAPISHRFCFVLLAMTVFLYSVFLTADYQAVRYFMPVIFIWETLLPLFLFSILGLIKSFYSGKGQEILTDKGIQVIVISLLIGLQLVNFITYLYIDFNHINELTFVYM